MWIVAAFITMICFGTNNMIFKWSTTNGLSKIHIQFVFYLVAFILTASYAVISGIHQMDIITMILGAVIGILNANGNIQMSKAFEKGPASLTSPLVSVNTIIPILSAALIFNEHITILQWVGIIVILGSAILIQYSPQASGGSIQYMPWLSRILFAIFSFGVLGILMRTSSYLHIDSLNTLICMYGGGAIYLCINSLLARENWQKAELKSGTLVGLFSIFGYSCYFFALNTGTASIVFPIVSLSCLVVVLGGCWIFKERLRSYQVVGVLSAVLGIILTKI